MRPFRGLLLVAALAALFSNAAGAPNPRSPHIGYLYPAGGQVGTVTKITAGGQNLRGVKRIYVTGEGVTAKVVRFKPSRRLNGEQRRELRKRFREARNKLAASQSGKGPDRARGREKPPRRQADKKQPDKKQPDRKRADKPGAGKKQADAGKKKKEVTLPQHPLLDKLMELGPRELKKAAEIFFDPTSRLQAAPAIGERVEIEITIAPGAAPGDRELRLWTPRGMTNPMCFQVGHLPEFREEEINDFTAETLPPIAPALVVNGQVTRRDLDRFRFVARKGQRLVIETQARRLVPYLADAVPGWFQATLSLRDATGREVRFADDYRFDPDPVLLYDVPEDGEYELTIRDAIHRGREDFVYRITVGEQPFITRMFPLGGRTGVATTAEIAGVNLPAERIELDTGPGGGSVRQAAWRGDGRLSNRVPYAVGDLPEFLEMEPNDGSGSLEPITLPRIVNGRIGKPGDVDAFRFEGRAGEEVVAEVYGRSLASPLDSLVRLTDSMGRVLAMNDDQPDRRIGLNTHQADSYLRFRLPADGTYRLELSDSQNHGGPEYAYRLRVSHPRPDFTVIVTPSCLNMAAGTRIPFTVHVVRKDGFDGDIRLELVGAPKGFALSGARIPAGRDRIRMTISAPRGKLQKPIPLVMEGIARIGEKVVRRPAIAAEDLMQAFLNRHLVPAEQLLVSPSNSRGTAALVKLADDGPTKIPLGGKAKVRINAPGIPTKTQIRFEINEPPPGVTLRSVGFDSGDLVLTLEVDGEKAKAGYADNLIVEAYAELPPAKNAAKGARRRQWFMGVLPAIPFVIVRE